jgi:FlaA1/EpsC-like NDP-sugar epimerase
MTLKELRKTCNLTQKEAAEISKTSLRSFISYENDEDAADQLRLQRIKEILEEYADNDTNILKDKVLLITGGTGSFGNAVLNRFLKTDIGEIRIFSRDEKKQDDMRHEYQAKFPEYFQKIKFYIGDVRSLESCR